LENIRTGLIYQGRNRRRFCEGRLAGIFGEGSGTVPKAAGVFFLRTVISRRYICGAFAEAYVEKA
jgi:hypothetical protein